jgi:salicylate hydroxylase
MTLQPYAKARASLGQGLLDSEDARQYSWVGNRSYIMHNVLSDGQLVQFVISSSDHGAESSDSWHRAVSTHDIKKLYMDWPTHLKQAVEEVLYDSEPINHTTAD